jgi:inorganic pyrophosphatase
VFGIIEGEQTEDGSAERSDRIVAIEAANHSFAEVKHVDDLGSPFEHELEEFFVNYHRPRGEKYRVIGLKGPAAARRAIKQARRFAKKKHKAH